VSEHVPGSAAPLLRVEDLVVEIPTAGGSVRPVRGVSFSLARGGSLALVGESGSGKTLTCSALTQLLPVPARVASGTIDFDGVDLATAAGGVARGIRGRRIGFVFQDPNASLDPLMPVGRQIAEVVRAHEGVGRREARRRAVALMDDLGIPQANRRADDYPHQFSGGMKQRIAIAAALAGDPELLSADEPTSALDVTTERRILELIGEIRRERQLALLLVTHSLGVAVSVVEEICVMYAGRVVEAGPAASCLLEPRHPYTEGLVACARSVEDPAVGRLATVGGTAPPLTADLDGSCAFAPRCPYATDLCRAERPALRPVEDVVCACHYPVREQVAAW
jgi:oligopeptide/dipeptide ABC transporter ATP-binding protein